MSANNGVYILVTKGAKKGKKEYRVVHAQAIENIWWQPDHPSDREAGLNREYVRLLFGECRVFTDRKLAEGYAQRISDEVEYTEYGIRFLDFTHIRFPQPLQLGVTRV